MVRLSIPILLLENLVEIYQSEYCITLDELPADLYTAGGTSQPSTKPTEAPDKPTEAPTNKPVEAEKLGDANCDDVVSMADAAAIYQALGNPDKYSLSAKGAANADCCNPGDGLTAADALAVQKFAAKIISALPEMTK